MYRTADAADAAFRPTRYRPLSSAAGSRVLCPLKHAILNASLLSAVVLCVLFRLHHMSNATAAGVRSGASCVLARQRSCAAPRRKTACCAQRSTTLLSSRCAGFASQAPLLEKASSSCRRLRRCSRAASHAARAEADGLDILAEVPQDGGGRAVRAGAVPRSRGQQLTGCACLARCVAPRQVRAALEALRNKRRERELVGFYSLPKGLERKAEPAGALEGAADPVAALREKHQQELTQLRTRLNGRLSKASAYARHCDKAIRNRDATVATLHEELTRMRDDLAALVTLAGECAADPRHTNFKSVAVAEKSKLLAESLEATIEHADRQRVRPVEIQWTGMAEDVRVMGSFDGWTHGVPLSPDERDAYTTHSAKLHLLPGPYEVKFLVDSQWRVAQDWPQTGEGENANNLLTVGDDASELTLNAQL